MDKQELIDCHERIKPFIHNTPVLISRLIDEMAGAHLFLSAKTFSVWVHLKCVGQPMP